MVAACGGGGKEQQGGGSGAGGGGGGGKRPVAVQVVTVAPRTVAETREVTGTLAAAREARLLAQLEGALTRVLVDEGDRVRAGQLLATFDNSVQEAELAGARTRARVARAAAERASRLLALGAASKAEQEEAAATLREAVGALRGAEARAAYGEVRAPFDGLVTAVRVNAGDVVGARQEVAVVADPAELRVEVPVSELDVVRLSPGDPVPVTVDALPGREFAGRVARIYPTVDAATRQGVVEVALRRAAPELRPGLLARLTLTVARAEGVLAAPLDAVRRDVRDQPYVYVVQDVFVREPADAGGRGEGKGESKGDEKKGASGDDGGKRGKGGEADTVVRRAQIVLRRPVRVGLRGGDNYVQLAEGVRPGDRVVVTGDQELSDSARVRVLPTREGGDRAARTVAEGGASGRAGSSAGGGASGGAGGAGGAPGDGGANANPGSGGRAGDAAVGGGAASAGADGGAGGAVGGSALGATSAAGGAGAAASGARSAASAGAAAGAAGSTAPGAARTPGAVGGVGATSGGGLSGGASASTGVPSRGGRAGATAGRAGARAGGTGRASGTAGAGTGGGGPGGGGGG